MSGLAGAATRAAVVILIGSVLSGCSTLRLPWFGDGEEAPARSPATAEPGVPAAPVSGGLVAVRLRVADNALRNKDYGTAERLFREAHEAAPDLAAPLSGLANALYGQGRYAEATVQFRAALARDATAMDIREGLAKALIATGMHAEARVLLEDAARTAGNASLLNKLGVARDLSGDGEAAQAAYRAALAHEPGNLSVRNNLALSLAISGRNQDAVREMEQVLRAAAGDSRYRANLSFIYGLGGDYAGVERLTGAVDAVERTRLETRYAHIRAIAASGDRATVLSLLGQAEALPETASAQHSGSFSERSSNNPENKEQISSSIPQASHPDIAGPTPEASAPVTLRDAVNEPVPAPPVESSGRRDDAPAARMAALPAADPQRPVEGSAEIPAQPASVVPDSATELSAAIPAHENRAGPVRPERAMAAEGWRVQLAAYRALAHSRRGAAIFAREFADVLPPIETLARRGGAGDPRDIRFRLRTAPLADQVTAARLCNMLRERGVDCLIVRQSPDLWEPSG